jgi:hypothetical protein
MNTYITRLNFFWDDDDDIKEVKIYVPENISDLEVAEILLKEHKFLCKDDDEDFYGTQGKNPETLLDYVCEKYDWRWKEVSFDIDLNFD